MVYAGVPAGVEAFRLAREVLDAEGVVPPPTDDRCRTCPTAGDERRLHRSRQHGRRRWPPTSPSPAPGLVCFDPAGTEARMPDGAVAAESIADLARRADTVLISVPDGAATLALPDEIVDGRRSHGRDGHRSVDDRAEGRDRGRRAARIGRHHLLRRAGVGWRSRSPRRARSR